ncbi:MAG: sel1 repeat family protein [Rhodospirillales bacterium]|nr:sel1 repeat family protein [Rhodospirillales bacterium]
MRGLIVATIFAVVVAVMAIVTVVVGPPEDGPLSMPVLTESPRNILMKQAAAGDVAAQYRFALLLLEGEDGKGKDPRKAFEWFKRAADKGYVKAQTALGNMYRDGVGVPASPFRAGEWYMLAATLGRDPEAQFAIGQLYFKGLGLPHDYINAIKFYRMAAEHDHPGAHFLLGAMYQDGWGLNQDPVQAYFWYSLAARQEDRLLQIDPRYTATVNRHDLGKTMNRFQISQAEKLVAQWERSHGPIKAETEVKR